MARKDTEASVSGYAHRGPSRFQGRGPTVSAQHTRHIRHALHGHAQMYMCDHYRCMSMLMWHRWVPLDAGILLSPCLCVLLLCVDVMSFPCVLVSCAIQTRVHHRYQMVVCVLGDRRIHTRSTTKCGGAEEEVIGEDGRMERHDARARPAMCRDGCARVGACAGDVSPSCAVVCHVHSLVIIACVMM